LNNPINQSNDRDRELQTRRKTDLAQIPAGKRFKVVKINALGEVRRRLLDIGFVKNQAGCVIREALLKDPIEVDIKGTKVSLRRSEARLICVEEAD